MGRVRAPCSGTMVEQVVVEPDIADVSGDIRYGRVQARLGARIAVVLAWALLFVVVIESPLWLGTRQLDHGVARLTQHLFGVFVPRGHAVAEFGDLAELQRRYADHGIARACGVAVLGLLCGVALQLTCRTVGGRLRRRREQWALFAWLAGALIGLRLCLLGAPLAATWIPVAAVLVPLALQLGRGITIAATLVLAAAVAVMVPPFDPVLGLTFAAQGLAIGFMAPRRRKGGWIWARPLVLASAIATTLAYLGAQLLVHGTLAPFDVASVEWGRLSSALVAGLCWPLVGLALDPIFEAAVGNVSRSSLLELSDLNNPVLQRISTRAPGTWAHSRAMANLAESAAHAVWADALLIRVGAYYHDLGKADEPQYFVENLPRGRISPHDTLTPEQSAAKIIHHVRSSVVRGRKAGLPEPIIDFMHTHHGGSRVEFFYQRARTRAAEAGDDPDRVDPAAFTYPGAKPDSPETGILMIVDSVEAASRTLDRPDRKQLDGLLRQIVFSKLGAGQLDDCGLSLGDLRRIMDSLTDSILAAAHDRITYPWQDEEKAAARAEAGMTEPSGATPLREPNNPLRVIADDPKR